MEAGLYLLAILGCGEGEAPCEQVRVAEARYQSREACLAATEEALMRNGDVLYPVVVAQCFAEGEPPVRVLPREVDRPGPATLPADPEGASSRT